MFGWKVWRGWVDRQMRMHIFVGDRQYEDAHVWEEGGKGVGGQEN